MRRFYQATFIAMTLFNVSPLAAQPMALTEDRVEIRFTLNGQTFVIERDQARAGAFAATPVPVRTCPPDCIQPMIAASGVERFGELDTIRFLETTVVQGAGLLIDSRLPERFAAGSIPGAVNVPSMTLSPDNPYLREILLALGAQDQSGGVLGLGDGVEVTRSQPTAVETFQPALRDVTRVLPTTTLRLGEETLDQTTAGVLAGLGLETAAVAPPPTDEMGQMTSGVLASIRAVTGEAAAPAAPFALAELVADALREGQTDQVIDQLVNEAALAGRVAVPNVLVTPEGKVDTSVLLASIITEARIAAGQPAPAVPDVVIGGEGVEVRVVQTATETEQFRFHTVNPGDSLGAIAIRFYGDAAFLPRIFDANRATLSTPDRIRVGQRPVIPAL